MPLGLTLRGVIDRARLNDILLVVVDAIAVHVHAYFDLVLFAVANIARIKCQTILTSKQAINRVQYVGNLTFKV